MNDRCFRCDETLVLQSLISMGLSEQSPLIMDLSKALIKKQQANGSWLFRGESSPWYTIEVLLALNYVDRM
jgi:hypothetical protein